MAAPGSINLLPKSDFEASFWGKFLKWGLSTGRYLVILTELVVIAAFLSRFKLDWNYAAVRDRINSKRAVLTAMAETERRFRLAQSRLGEAGKIMGEQMETAKEIEKVTAKVPRGIVLTDLTVSNKVITVAGSADNADEFGVFLSRLAGNPDWKSVRIKSLSADGQAGFKFLIWLN